MMQQLHDALFEEKGIELHVLRLDNGSPVSGNKPFKLKYNLEAFLESGKSHLLTFGGAYSNHIAATAVACRNAGISAIGIIRGEELNEHSNSRLRFARECGMKLVFVSRGQYRRMREGWIDPATLPVEPDSCYMLPEGGSNQLAVEGCMEITQFIPPDFQHILCACGTGATLAGISLSLGELQRAEGIAVLREETHIENAVARLNNGKKNYRIHHHYHFGGYGKTSAELEMFCGQFTIKHNIPVEPVYTGKLFYGITGLVNEGYFPAGSSLVAVHTGGIFEERKNES